MSARGRGARLTPYLLGLPGGLWLAIFFVIPILVMLSLSLQSGNVEEGFRLTWRWANYADAWTNFHTQFVRSIVFGLIVTVISLVLAYPMAYWIAFYGGSRKSTYLFLILLPFFVSFVIRTASWKFILADEGIVLGPLKDAGLLPRDFHILATATAVIGGLTYNYLPFMVLPLYVALERVDPSLVEAAHDLYASRAQAFRRVVLPLSLPGVFAGVLITFVPVTSDFVNNGILGGTRTTMIGNVIQTQYLTFNDYPLAAAMSFMLMAALLVGIFAYARTLGTEQVLEASQL
jgi:spermidine/putrescine transport system permease protein